ncbi:MAG: GatB/YqeY domain-containing protein [Dehalococcoidia bacterium]
MVLKDQLNDDLRSAMRGGDDVRKLTLRGLLAAVRSAEDAAVKSRLDAAGAAARDDGERLVVDFGDDEVIQVIRRQVKQRQDSIEQFEKAGRQDLVRKESAEMAVLQAYLPQQMGRDQIEQEARAVIAETGATGPADKSKVMPVLIKRLAGKADGREINAVVTQLLAG